VGRIRQMAFPLWADLIQPSEGLNKAKWPSRRELPGPAAGAKTLAFSSFALRLRHGFFLVLSCKLLGRNVQKVSPGSLASDLPTTDLGTFRDL
jgi:hypothetical protein